MRQPRDADEWWTVVLVALLVSNLVMVPFALTRVTG